MFELALNSEYFTRFPPKTTSRYQEGFEYLDFISTWYNLRCAIRALMIATNIDFDLDLENSNGVIIDREQTKERVLNANIGDYRSQHRLEQIAHLLRNNKRKTVGMVQKRHCPIDCRSEQCPLEDYISNHLGWRV